MEDREYMKFYIQPLIRNQSDNGVPEETMFDIGNK